MEGNEKETVQVRTAAVCQRCRLKKIKCDEGIPRCRGCERNNLPCMQIDPSTGHEMPRGYVQHLEEELLEWKRRAQVQITHSSSLNTSAPRRASPEPHGHLSLLVQEALGQTSSFEEKDYTIPNLDTHNIELDQPSDDPFNIKSRVFMMEYMNRVNVQVPVMAKDKFLAQLDELAGYSSMDSISYSNTFLSIAHLILALGLACRSDFVPNGDERAHAHLALSMRLRMMDTQKRTELREHCMFGRISTTIEPRLEAIQFSLLVALFSLMRPVSSGTWHLLGAVMRQCTALGLQRETPLWIEEVPENQRPALLDECRRIFWASYCLDRFVSMNMMMPVSLPEYNIRAPLPWILEASRSLKGGIDGDSALESKASYQAMLDANVSFMHKDPSSWASIFFIKLRQIQSEVYRVFADQSEVPRHFESLSAWLQAMDARLSAWCEYAPLSHDNLAGLGCAFNTELLELNLLQTRQLLQGVQVRFDNPASLDELAKTASHILKVIARLEDSGHIHFSWITLHNLCVASTVFVCCIQKRLALFGACPLFVSREEVELIAYRTDRCFRSIRRRCRSGHATRRALQDMFDDLVQLLSPSESSAGSRPNFLKVPKEMRKRTWDQLQTNLSGLSDTDPSETWWDFADKLATEAAHHLFGAVAEADL